MSIAQIMAALPHRYPFLLLDRLLTVEPGVRVVGLKNVTINEPYFAGHFPDEPVVPGVLLLEAMAQCGGFLFEVEGRRGYIAAIDKARFVRPVVPGDQLIIEMRLLQRLGDLARAAGEAKVDGQRAATAEITYRFREVSGA
ncbi:MAG: 3-hydroxyacyl-ACP dehydratase FabZ [Symbiobacterium sp.]|mgnify:CR=1 FL=1|uniref:3-hydroxyacyl-ACP dehydratase FabZ n=1 Tax=Symbiobacterium sp. TaxID=1971213 RepID=UPI0034641582